MDPVSIVALAATVLEIGIRVSGHLGNVVATWKSADPVILALANEISDLTVVLDHMNCAWKRIRDISDPNDASDVGFLGAFNGALLQAELHLQELERVIIETGSLGNLKRKYKWLRNSAVAKDMQAKLRDVRLRLTELLITYNASSVSRIEFQIKEVHAAIKRRNTEPLLHTGRSAEEQVEDFIHLQQSFLAHTKRQGSKLVTSSELISHQPSFAASNGQLSGPTDPLWSVSSRTPAVRFVGQPRLNLCDKYCRCRCHSSGGQRIRLGSAYLGKLFIGYSGIPGLSPTCSLSKCRSRGTMGIEVSYTFPMNFLFSVSAYIATSLKTGPRAGLFVQKRVVYTAETLHYAAVVGDLGKIQELVDDDPFSVNYGLSNGRTPIRFAFSKQNYNAVELLLQHGADIDAEDDMGMSLRHVAGREFLNSPQSSGIWTRDKLFSLFNLGCLLDDVPILIKAMVGMIQADFEDVMGRPSIFEPLAEAVNTPIFGETPLHLAVTWRNIRAIRALLAAGADPNLQNAEGFSSLWNTQPIGPHPWSEEVFDLLVDAGADIDIINPKTGYPLLHHMAEYGYVDMVRKLLCMGADANKKSLGCGVGYPVMPAIVLAPFRDCLSVLETLMEYGADINVATSSGETTLLVSVMYNAHKCIEFLLRNGADPCACWVADDCTLKRNILHEAAVVGDLETMQILRRASKHLWGLDGRRSKDGETTPDDMFQQRASKSEGIEREWVALLDAIDEVMSVTEHPCDNPDETELIGVGDKDGEHKDLNGELFYDALEVMG